MKTTEEYLDLLIQTEKAIEDNYPNYKMISDKGKFASLFSKCLPDQLTYEDICILCFYEHARPQVSVPTNKEDRLPTKKEELN